MTDKTILISGMILGAILITGFSIPDASAAAFAKYDGIDGESSDDQHDKWIDILSIDWGSHRTTDTSGQDRKRGGVIVEDIVLTMEFEKSTVKLLEKMNMGEVIPKLEIEQTAAYGPEGERVVTYLKYELINVQVTSFDVNASGNDESPPTVTIANNFEEYKVTYTEYDSEGNKGGNAETTWKVEKGEK
jgi:type VI secretion system secreted protein Hcp